MKALYLSIFLLMFISVIRVRCEVYDLRCEHLTNPLGMDVETPHFSWKIAPHNEIRGFSQTGYRILVASSPEKLKIGKADVWDSQPVKSSQSHLIPFGGKLKHGQRYYWKVTVYAPFGKKQEAESRIAHFSTGLPERNEWNGDWIKHPSASSEKHIWFRKKLTLSSKPSANALAYLASIGYHELYVNGKKVDNNRVLAPTLSRIDKRVTYVTYDIAPFLKAGDNVIAIWYAAGWSRNDYFAPYVGQALLVQVNGKTKDGRDFMLASDSTWKCAESYSRNTGLYQFRDMGGEEIDGRRYTTAWNTVDFNDASWQTTQTTTPLTGNKDRILAPTGIRLIPALTDSLVLSAQMTDPSRIVETIAAHGIADTIAGKWSIDMGKSFTGFIEARFNGLRSGDTVLIQVSNRKGIVEEFKQRQYYIARGENGETFTNRFNFVSGQYVHFTGLRQAPALSDIKAHAVSSAGERTGYFSCSDTLFNKIYEADRWTYEMCHTEGVIVDCPNRERLGYGMEGAYQTTWGLGLPCFRSAAYYVKNIRDWSDVQAEDGKMNYVAPQISVMWGNTMAGTASMNMAWELYNSHGDKRPLEVARETGRRYLDFLFRNLDEDGLLQPYEKREGFFLGEWIMPGDLLEIKTSDLSMFFNNCIYAVTLDLYIRISEILGKENETALYRERLQTLRSKLHHKYYNPELHSYVNGDQPRTAFALYAGIVPENLQADVLQHLEDDLRGEHPYFNIGSYSRYYYYHILFAHRRFTDIIYNIMKRTDNPSYGYFLSVGETTWAESWGIDDNLAYAKIHTGNTGISSWFIKSLAGIEPTTDNPGYRTVIIRPHVPAKLDHAKAGVETPYGMVESGWYKKDGATIYEITIPPNCDAEIYLPASKITENGGPLDRIAGVKSVMPSEDCVLIKALSGKYRFESN